MKMNFSKKIGSRLLNGFYSLFGKKEEPVSEVSPAEAITKEIDELWEVARKKDEGLYSEEECREKLIDSFNGIKAHFSNDQLDSAYAWPRYVKIAVHSIKEPVKELVTYVDENNYISLTKRLSDLSNSVYKGEEENARINMENFSAAVYLHILDDINPKDVPSCLALGRMSQRRREYDTARGWFERATETEDPFNGVTALLACYEDETKAVLLRGKNRYASDPELREKVRALNESQCSVYEKWCCIVEEHINDPDETTEQYKCKYVFFMTGYARFERNRGNYDKALELLYRVPKTYPGVYRVYAEEAMLYQFKPYRNSHYCLEKAIEAFKKAEEAINTYGKNDEYSIKSKKSILMPLANTYFQSGRYDEASRVCERVLEIDSKEQRAINLKHRIDHLAA